MATQSPAPSPSGATIQRVNSSKWQVLYEFDTEEVRRLREDEKRQKNWKRWGPYLSERQWGTVREDYSPDGSCWEYFSHDDARSRAYRWGEDGLLGITDRECRLCFALALWNGKDPILKERLYGLTGPQGNHGEDVKECYYYLDSTPTHSYMKGLYKYPQSEYPYSQLERENRERGLHKLEYELSDSGVFDDNKYWDVFAEYAKQDANDVLIKITVANRGPEAATIHVLPTFWYRNTWIWGCKHEGCTVKPRIAKNGQNSVTCTHQTLDKFHCYWDVDQQGKDPELWFTENETNSKRLYGSDSYTAYVKDAFHRCLINGEKDAIQPKQRGTKVAGYYKITVEPGKSHTINCRMTIQGQQLEDKAFTKENFHDVFGMRKAEADDFYAQILPEKATKDELLASRQAYAGLLWSKQFYHYVIKDWLEGDPDQPKPPSSRNRNLEWQHLFNRDVLSMPDKWEYPWFASWDLAFHMIPFSVIDPQFAKDQLMVLLREWYMAPNGQIPAYEFNFSDVNPPVHAVAAHIVYKMTGRKGVFDRSKPLPEGMDLEQADGTAWMAFFSIVMLGIALDLAVDDSSYEDMASKFFEHFIAIVDAMNQLSGCGLWNEEDGFYYDQLRLGGNAVPLKVRSMVGLVPLFSCLVLEDDVIKKLPGFKKRLDWFLKNRQDLASQISYMSTGAEYNHLLAVPSRDRLERVLKYMLDEEEFLSPYGIRSLSKYHEKHPYYFNCSEYGEVGGVEYMPAESNTYLFGGNSNWRGPVWFPMNALIIEALERYDYFYGDSLLVECPTGSGNKMRLKDVSVELSRRLGSLFLQDKTGKRPCHGEEARYKDDEHWKNLILFYEFFHAENGRGCGASHQTGWTALAATCIAKDANTR
eukprot:Seg1430.11 transcript_id=Seg1430.11/GoldUCD/mRNA.D3Y31 product="putative protein" protein_id=Seg1430.11/GoldUCD/D3Y31